MKIKTFGIKYPQTRLIMNKLGGVEYEWVQIYPNPILKKILHTYEVYKSIGDFDVTGYHTVNTMMITRKPWCCSFETVVPRGFGWGCRPWLFRWLVEKVIMKDNCKRLIAFSECNLGMQREVWKQFPEIEEQLNKKTIMLKVPQELLVDHAKEQPDKVIHFVFVGYDFVRKGARDVVEAMRQLREIRQNFDLTLITVPKKTANYAFGRFQDKWDDVRETVEYMKSQPWIKVHERMPNAQVLQLLKTCDVGLLPTWADTYGYSTLEMQAAGLPCITTNVRAQPEINCKGWIVDLPERFDIHSVERKMALREQLQKGLYDIILNILDHPETIHRRAVESLEYIRKYHSPQTYAEELKKIYSEF